MIFFFRFIQLTRGVLKLLASTYGLADLYRACQRLDLCNSGAPRLSCSSLDLLDSNPCSEFTGAPHRYPRLKKAT